MIHHRPLFRWSKWCVRWRRQRQCLLSSSRPLPHENDVVFMPVYSRTLIIISSACLDCFSWSRVGISTHSSTSYQVRSLVSALSFGRLPSSVSLCPSFFRWMVTTSLSCDDDHSTRSNNPAVCTMTNNSPPHPELSHILSASTSGSLSLSLSPFFSQRLSLTSSELEDLHWSGSHFDTRSVSDGKQILIRDAMANHLLHRDVMERVIVPLATDPHKCIVVGWYQIVTNLRRQWP